MSIREKQNYPASLAKLAAQHLLYRRAKRMRNIGMALVLLIAIGGLAASVMENQSFSHFFPLIALVMWFLDQQILKRKEIAFKTEAATIQEDFDCFVLDLPWPAHKGLQRPTLDRVKHLSTIARRTPRVSEKLGNWYTPDEIPDDPIRSKIHCQRMSCWWDVSLRRQWSTVLRVVLWVFTALVLCLSVTTGITVAKLVAILASNIRILAWGLGEISDQAEVLRHIEGIHRYLSCLSTEKQVSATDIRSLQDEIFEHRRSNPPVPDWFYWWQRDCQELEAAKPYNGETP